MSPVLLFVSKNIYLLKMVISCSAYECKETFIKGGPITFHSFPKDVKRRSLWETQLKRKGFKASNSSKICSKHFEEKCFDRSKFGGTWLKDDALPTIFNSSKHFEKNMNQKKCLEGTEEDRLDEVPDFHVTKGIPTAIYFSNFDSIPSSNVGPNLWTSEINHHNGERKYVTSDYVIEDEISIEKETDEENDDDDSLTSVSSKSENLSKKDSNENHDKPLQDRLKYFIFGPSKSSKPVNPVVSKQTTWVTHEEALRSAETLFHYMVNQDDVSNMDVDFITNYMAAIKERISKEGNTSCDNLETKDSTKSLRLAS